MVAMGGSSECFLSFLYAMALSMPSGVGPGSGVGYAWLVGSATGPVWPWFYTPEALI